jgi:tRNA (guanine37-N1)-methyltransferase
MSGHHEKIRAWRRLKAEETTRLRRPDLWAVYQDQKSRIGAAKG